jgi:hypothetical protein
MGVLTASKEAIELDEELQIDIVAAGIGWLAIVRLMLCERDREMRDAGCGEYYLLGALRCVERTWC